MTRLANLKRARQLRAIWERKAQEHRRFCLKPAPECRRCVGLNNYVAGLTRMLRVMETGDWGSE